MAVGESLQVAAEASATIDVRVMGSKDVGKVSASVSYREGLVGITF